jgi:hypothetical protein
LYSRHLHYPVLNISFYFCHITFQTFISFPYSYLFRLLILLIKGKVQLLQVILLLYFPKIQ